MPAWQIVGGIAVAVFASAWQTARATDWLQFGFDAAHSGNNAQETTIGPANAAALKLVYSTPFLGTDGTPALLSQVATASGMKNLLFLTTVRGISAIDAANGAVLWTQSIGQYEYSQGTSPAIDPSGLFVYGPGSDGRIHKLDVADGSEIIDANWPVVSSRKPAVEKSTSSLTIAIGPAGSTYLYSATSSFNDLGDYQGHLTTIDLNTAATSVFNAACSNLQVHFVENGMGGINDCPTTQNGIWGRAAATYDVDTNRIYFTTGNGVYDANRGGHNWGDTVLALDIAGGGLGSGLPRDSYTPSEYDELSGADEDLGSGSPAVLPVVNGSAISHLGLQIGKDAIVRLLDMDNLSGNSAPGFVGGELQKLALVASGFQDWATPQPAIWTNVDGDHSVWAFVSAQGTLSGLQVTVSGGRPQLVQRWTITSMSVSSSPIVAGDVLYAMTAGKANAVIKALNPTTGNVLWSSPPIGDCCHTQSPIVVNGRLYIAGSANITVFSGPSLFRDGFD